MRPAEALERLVDGNARFVRGATIQAPPMPERLAHLALAQHPFATILGCSDSRVPPEIVFDQGPGDLFIVRVAGNVIGTETLGSLAYALGHLRTPLFMVLGHECCGAVEAALRARGGATEGGTLADLLAAILPALDDVDTSATHDVQLHHAVEANVRWTVRQLAANPAGRAALAAGDIQVIGAVYELAIGRVRLLDP